MSKDTMTREERKRMQQETPGRPLPQTIRVPTRMVLTIEDEDVIELQRAGQYLGTIILRPIADKIKVDVEHTGHLVVTEWTPEK